MKIEITDKISVAHFLPALRDDHPCSGMHGHEMTVTITVEGEVKPEGWIIPFERLVEIWERCVWGRLDHCVINNIIEHPTCENVAKWIADQLTVALCSEGVELAQVSVGEMLKSRVQARAIWTPSP